LIIANIEALATSSVKVRGYDVLATWKIMISSVGFPALYLFIAIITDILLIYVTPLSLGEAFGIGALVFFMMPFVTYLTVRIAEQGKDVFFSIKPLAVSVFVPRRQTDGLRVLRRELQEELRAIVDEIFRPDEPLLDSEGRSPVHKRRDTIQSAYSEITDHCAMEEKLLVASKPPGLEKIAEHLIDMTEGREVDADDEKEVKSEP
jgi:glycerol-3-phosphate O-acyltransferase/dihydroxyacetone phosphate acyltransferase